MGDAEGEVGAVGYVGGVDESVYAGYEGAGGEGVSGWGFCRWLNEVFINAERDLNRIVLTASL